MELKELLDKCINDRLIDLTISGQKVKNEEGVKHFSSHEF